MAEKRVRTSKQVYERYLGLTRHALKKVKIAHLGASKEHSQAEDLLDMAEHYFNDAQHFHKKGMVAEALAAVSYANAWLDAGARTSRPGSESTTPGCLKS